MKNKVFSLAELRREAKGQKIKFEMIERYGKTGEAIPERLRGIREVSEVNTVGIKLVNQSGAISELSIPRASLINYDGDYLKVYIPGLREPTDAEKKLLSEWEAIQKAKEKQNPYMNTYWAKYDFFRNSAFPYMSGLHTGSRSKKEYIPSEGKVRDPNIKGTCILIDKVHHV